MENWKPLYYKQIDLRDRFAVSDKGRIYSKISRKIMKQTLNKNTRYYSICVSLGGRRKKMAIKPHIAVASMFCDGYKEGLVVNHKDGNKTNNQANNLEWVTLRENRVHALKNNLAPNHTILRCVNTGDIFYSVADACRWCGLSVWSSSISEYLNGNGEINRKTAGKHPITKEPLQWEVLEKF